MSKRVTIELPFEPERLCLPAALDRRMHALLDQRDCGNTLDRDELAELEGLVELVDVLTLLRLRTTSGSACT